MLPPLNVRNRASASPSPGVSGTSPLMETNVLLSGSDRGDIGTILTGECHSEMPSESLGYWQSAYLKLSRQFQSVVNALDRQTRALGVERELRRSLTAIANSSFEHEEPRVVLNTLLLRAIDVICERAGGQAFFFITPDGMTRFLANAKERQQYIFSTSTSAHARFMHQKGFNVPNFDHTPMFQAAVSGGREIIYSGSQIQNALIANTNEEHLAAQQGRKPVIYCALPPGHFGIDQLWLSPFHGCLLGCCNGEYPTALREAVNSAMPVFLDSVIRVVAETAKTQKEAEQHRLDKELTLLHRKMIRIAGDYDDVPDDAIYQVLKAVPLGLSLTYLKIEEKDGKDELRGNSVPSNVSNGIYRIGQYRLGSRLSYSSDSSLSDVVAPLFDPDLGDQMLLWCTDRKPTRLDSNSDLLPKLADTVLVNPMTILPIFNAGRPVGALIIYGEFPETYATTLQDAMGQSIALLQRKSESIRHHQQLQGGWQIPEAIKYQVAHAMQIRQTELTRSSIDKSLLKRSVLLSWRASQENPLGLLMADLVGSTVWEARAGPIRMAEMYTSLWGRLSDSMQQFPSVIPFKIIGDAYVALSGLIPESGEKLTDLVQYGLTIHGSVSEEWQSSEFFTTTTTTTRRASCPSQSTNPERLYMRIGCGATDSERRMYCYVGVQNSCPILDVTGTGFSEVERMMKLAPPGRAVITNRFLAERIYNSPTILSGHGLVISNPTMHLLQGHGNVETYLVTRK